MSINVDKQHNLYLDENINNFAFSENKNMKNVSSLKSNSKLESPKTPGGISKALLTPCRRVGLSRNWRKSGPSPFVSPLAGSAEVKLDKKEDAPTKRDTRKRKERCDEDETKIESLLTPKSQEITFDIAGDEVKSVKNIKNDDLETTPSRNVSNPRKKKSKTLLSSHMMNKDTEDVESPKTDICIENVEVTSKSNNLSKDIDTNILSCNEVDVSTPVRSKSKSKIKSKLEINSSKVIESKENICSNANDNEAEKVAGNSDHKTSNNLKSCKQKSPDNLTKECIVVLQKKIFKKDLDKIKQRAAKDEIEVKKGLFNPVSQALFDSDSDDVPLSTFNNKEVKCKPKDTFDDDDDFAEVKVKKLVDKTTSIGLTSEVSKKKTKQKKDILSIKSKPKIVETKVLDAMPSSQSSIDDDEDFVIDNKRTIIIRKTYDKVTKPLKAKSTGSITQKDIDELKAKIEVKKKLLLAKAVTKDTEELRDLIKKWQKGCQDALMELMELMKTKFPDKQNMDYSEILQTLKIPASLVGYDEDNDCFSTPTDENIILSKFNDT